MRAVSFVIVLFFSLLLYRADAQVEEQRYMQFLPLASVTTGSTITVKDPVDVNRYGEKSYKVLVKLVYGREGRTDVAGKTFSCSINNYSLAYLNQQSQVNSTTQNGDALALTYNGDAGSNTEAYQALTVPADAGNWCGATLTITSAPTKTNVPADVRLEVHLICTYRLKPDLVLLFNGGLSFNGTTKEFVWPYQRGASSYQLEWVYIDNESVFSPVPVTAADYFLLKEPVRVLLKEQYFHFEPRYAAGKVYARVRAVWQYGGDANNQPHFCDWQYLSSPTQINIVNTTPGTNEIQSFEVNKNWQYVTSYAEGGKTAQSAAFFDGSQRSRQNITLANSENIEMVNETLYDYEGRPVINIMPYPVAATSMNYRFRENVFSGEGITPNKSIYDNPYSGSSSMPLDSVSGAANYYSSSNTIINARNTVNAAYLPRAKGYAYSQVQYMTDGTGRPIRQNTPGEAFVLDQRGGNFTSYYYDQAKPMELQRLFGSNVGNAQHYEKNYVVDNNGQVSVSYLDQFGKVVATALRGEAPKKSGAEILSPLLDNAGSPNIIVALNAQNKYDPSTGSLTSVNTQVNIKNPTTYSLHYDLKGVVDKAVETFPACNACSYDLEILITDPDGLEFSKPTFTNLTASSFACSSSSFPILPAYDADVTFTKLGTYTITKKLTLNKASMDALTAAIASSPLAPNLDAIKATYRAAADYSSCDLTCRDRALTANPTLDPSSPSYIYNINNETYLKDWMKLHPCDNTQAVIEEIEGKTCASMLQLMTEELTSLGITSVTNHPEYCHYTACLREAASSTYDFKMAAIANWTDAVAKGYHNPLQMTNSTIPAGTATVFDPLLTTTLFTSSSSSPFNSKYNYVVGQLLNYMGTGMTLWQYASSGAYYPLGSTAWSNLSAEDKDAQRWRTFCGAYQGLKQQIFYELKTTASANSWTCAYRDPQYAIVQDPYLVNNVAAIEAKSNSLQNAGCGSLCGQNATAWVNNLIDGGCTSLTESEKTTVILSLKNYCLANCGSANPWGLLLAEHITEVRAGLNLTTKPGYQYLKNALLILDAKVSCDLLNTSFTTPYTYGTSTAAPSKIPTQFTYELINGTNKLLEEARTKTNLITSCPDNTNNLFLNNAYSINFGSDGYYYQYNTLMQDPVFANSQDQSFATRFVSFVNDEAMKIGPYYYVAPTASALRSYVFSTFELDGTYNNAIFTNLYPCNSGCQYATSDPGKLGSRMLAAYYFVSYNAGTYSKIPKSTIYNISSNPRYKSMPVYSYLSADGSSYATTSEFIELDAILIDINGKKYSTIIYLPNFAPSDVQSSILDFYLTLDLCVNKETAQMVTPPILKSNTVTTTSPVTGLTTCSNPVQPATGPKTFCNKFTVSLKTLRDQCHVDKIAAADALAQQKYNELLQTFTTNFLTNHVATCFNSNQVETFTLKYSNTEYQYTLYYYDQAGNLIATVPPEGVYPLQEASFTNGVLNTGVANPAHKLHTFYRYNSTGQLVSQESPDGGVSKFFYDSKGQLRLSQNAKQKLASGANTNKYSYSKYDAQGRVVESGEVQDLTQAVSYFTDAGTRKDALASLDNAVFPNSNNYKDVVKTTYDVGAGQNLRSRVAVSVTLKDGLAADNRTSYSYDIHGNVKLVTQEAILNQPKLIEYSYDLISCAVKRMDYQKNFADQYAIKYSYDADNRLRNTYSSFDNGLTWKEDAEYFYYLHGTLARTEYGQSKVQGMDYAYTLQGWIKMGNTPHERTQPAGYKYRNTQDIGNDGISGVNQYVGQDEFAFALGYHNKDYSAIGAATTTGFVSTAAAKMNAGIAGPGLYNGNITWQITQLNRLAEMKGGTTNENVGIRAAAYKYDQLNRLKQASNYILPDAPGGGAPPVAALTPTGSWNATYGYDRNGNIMTAVVNGSNTNVMDQLGYNYLRDGNQRLISTNRLNSVSDGAGINDAIYTTDINSGQGASNYTYDAIGNLTGDVADESTIEWTVSGKVRKVTKSGVVLEYTYDAAGNRVSKKATYSPSGSTTLTTYVRDAGGNVLATYVDNGLGSVMDVEYNLYGSNRIGRVLASSIPKSAVATAITQPDTRVYVYKPGIYQYELSNHLGNVQAVVTGLKVGENTDGNPVNAEIYRCSIVSLTDYYSFGMEIEGRSYFNMNAYRYGFNGKEKDGEGMGGGGSTYDYGFRIYNPALGKFLSVDPLTSSYPYYTPYQYAGNKPIHCIDLDGLEDYWSQLAWDQITSGYNYGVNVVSSNYTAAVATVKSNYNAAVSTVKSSYTDGVSKVKTNYNKVVESVKTNYPKTYNAIVNTNVDIKYESDVTVGLQAGASFKNPTGIYGVKFSPIATSIANYTEQATMNFADGVKTNSSSNVFYNDNYTPVTTSEINAGIVAGSGYKYEHQTGNQEIENKVGPISIKDKIGKDDSDAFSLNSEVGGYAGFIFGFEMKFTISISNPGLNNEGTTSK